MLSGNGMKKFKVIVASTIIYEAEIEAEHWSQIHADFDNGKFDFTEWEQVELESEIETIKEVK